MRAGCGCSFVIHGGDTRLITPDPLLHLYRRPSTPTRAALGLGSFKIKAKIEEARKPVTFYDLLGIPESGSLPEIKQAYKQLARKYHPDVSPPDKVDEYTERFIRVQEAYETLSDQRRRALYDRDLSTGLHLAFNARRSYRYDEELEERSGWKTRWQGQVSELKRRSMNRDAGGSMSWGARMRRQRDELSDDQ